jgi:DNA-directed RNA polymerase I, II, and III subunit RPABC1
VFPIKTLMFNVTKHKCVPLHERLESSMEIDRIKESYHLESLEQLPQIMDTDPVAKFIGLRPGDVCKITRPSLSSGKHIAYRHCVAGSI